MTNPKHHQRPESDDDVESALQHIPIPTSDDDDDESALPPHIPTDLLSLILARLPIKAIFRFRCVSPLWNSIISDDPLFEKLQFDYSKPTLLISTSTSTRGEFFTKEFSQPSKVIRLPLPHPPPNVKRPLHLDTESVGGLILDYSRGPMWMRIYNPSTGELSDDIVVQTYKEEEDGIRMKFERSMLGYDPDARIHKILGLWVEIAESSKFNLKMIYRVLTLDKQMEWRTLTGGVGVTHPPIDYKIGSTKCLDGVIYYIGKSNNYDSGDLMSSRKSYVGLDFRRFQKKTHTI